MLTRRSCTANGIWVSRQFPVKSSEKLQLTDPMTWCASHTATSEQAEDLGSVLVPAQLLSKVVIGVLSGCLQHVLGKSATADLVCRLVHQHQVAAFRYMQQTDGSNEGAITDCAAHL